MGGARLLQPFEFTSIRYFGTIILRSEKLSSLNLPAKTHCLGEAETVMNAASLVEGREWMVHVSGQNKEAFCGMGEWNARCMQ